MYGSSFERLVVVAGEDENSSEEEEQDDAADLQDEGDEEGGPWAKKFRHEWQKEKRSWVDTKHGMPHLGRARTPKGIVKNKWPVATQAIYSCL